MDREQLIAAVSRATGVRLDPADPVLAAATINEVLLDQALAKFDRQMKLHADRMVAASAQMLVDAKKEAEALLTEGGVWAEVRIKAAGESAAAMVLADLRQETVKAERAHRAAVRMAWVTALVGLVILSGLGGIALAAISPL
jgi:sorbitol-specific phosphotransferase system component IIBC